MCYPYADALQQVGPRIEYVELILQKGNYELSHNLRYLKLGFELGFELSL